MGDQDEPEDEVVEALKEVIPARKIADGLKKKRKKKNAMKDAIEWFRNHDQDFDDVSDSTVEYFTSITGVPNPKQLTQKSKAKAMEDSIQWLRTNDPELDYVDVGTLQAFTDMTGVPTPNIITSQRKKREKAKGVVKWLEDQDE